MAFNDGKNMVVTMMVLDNDDNNRGLMGINQCVSICMIINEYISVLVTLRCHQTWPDGKTNTKCSLQWENDL